MFERGKTSLASVAVILFSSCTLCILAEDEVKAPQPKAASVSFGDVGLVEFEPAPEGSLIRYTLDGSAPSAKSFAVCTPVRVASPLKLKAACFTADGKSSPVVEIQCIRTPGEDNKKLSPAINIDFSETPELKDWALRAQKDADDYYPTICKMLSEDGFSAPRQVTLFFKKDMKGVAYTVNKTITFAGAYIQGHPKDTGTVIHELAHVIQAYHSGKNPGWLVEGIADYVRWFNWEPLDNRRKVNPQHAKYTNGYSDAAEFLVWIEKTYDKEIVAKLNVAMRKGAYSDELFKKYAGKDIPALWAEFIESVTKKTAG